MLTRRTFLQGAGAGLALNMPGVSLALANASTDSRFVFIFLRGGLDGLHALAPYKDPHYVQNRPTLALPEPGKENGVIDLDGRFGLHPALGELHPLYQNKELLFVPAAATRYQDRSHFDAQNMLENGSGKPFGARDGWLNRAIAGLNQSDTRLGLALGPSMPLIMQGDARVQTWANSRLPKADDDFLARMLKMYESDDLFAKALSEAQAAMQPMLSKADKKRTRGNKQFGIAAKAAADLLSRDDGPRIAAMQLQGWDTHFAQARRLSTLFTELAGAINILKTGLGKQWANTVVLTVSEFGRTLAENGNRGTDHGTASIAMLAGGSVAGGRVVGQWPGLAPDALRESRDVATANHYERIFKSVLIEHLGATPSMVEQQVFANSAALRPMPGLFRTS